MCMQDMGLELCDDDEPTKRGRRFVTVTRTGLDVAGQQAVLASVNPPLAGNGWGTGTSLVILVSRTRGVTINQMTSDPSHRPARVFVCRYLGDFERMPTTISRSDIRVEFWGLLK
jgi:hypothetical protein